METSPIDSLKIVVNTDSGKAISSLKNLASALKEVKSAQSGGFNGINNLAKYITKLGKSLDKVDIKKLNKITEALSHLKEMAAFRAGVANLNKSIASVAKFQAQVEKAQAKVGTTKGKKEGGQSEEPLPGEEYNYGKERWGEYKKGNTTYGYYDTTNWSDSKKNNAFDKLREKLQKLNKKVKELWGALKRIAMYRAIRTAIKLIGDAISDGIKNTYIFSIRYGTQFVKSLDNITASLNYMKNALGSAASELIMALEPAIVSLCDSLAVLANRLAEMFAYLRGSSVYLKAAKNAIAYGTALSGLNRTILKFDEINKISGTTTTMTSADVDKSSAKSTLGWVTALAGIIASIKAFNFLGKLYSAITGNSSGEMWRRIGNWMLLNIQGLVQKIPVFFSSKWTIVVDFFKNIWGNVSGWFSGIWSSISNGFNASWAWVSVFFKNIFQSISTFFSNIVTKIKGFATSIGTVATSIASSISKFLPGIGAIAALAGVTTYGKKELQEDDNYNILEQAWNKITSVFGGGNNPFTNVRIGNQIGDKYSSSDGSSDASFGEKVKMWLKNTFGINAYASGGFPEDGMFFANHGELVGGFSNGRTAVANNEQITTGIREAVYDAIVTAGGMSGGNWTIEIKSDGITTARKTITNAERMNRINGKTVMAMR